MQRWIGLLVCLAMLFCRPLLHGETASLSNRDFAEQIFERLAHVLGRGGSAPRLHVQTDSEIADLAPGRRETERVAFLRSTPGPVPRREVVIDDKTIAICRATPERAEGCLAFFLGHELAHYVNHHDWGPHFARKMGFGEVAR